MFSILPVYLIRILKIPWRIYVIISIWILDFNKAANFVWRVLRSFFGCFSFPQLLGSQNLDFVLVYSVFQIFSSHVFVRKAIVRT